MKALQVISTAYRATIEEQDDTSIWIAHVMKTAGAELAVLLRGNAVNYAVRGQDASGLAFGDKKQTQPPRLADDLGKLIATGVDVHVVADDAEARGISTSDLIAGVRPIGGGARAVHAVRSDLALVADLGRVVMPEWVVNFAATQTADQEGRLDAPSFHRNHEPIWSVLGPRLADQSGDVLELGSGTGQHVIEFARRAPAIRWQPSDLAAEHLCSIEGWRKTSGLANVRVPVAIDLSVLHWPSLVEVVAPASLLAILCINVLHISAWRVSEHLFAGASRLMRPDGRLFVYGPFKRGGEHTSSSNADFDASLRGGNPEWGVRDMDDLSALADRAGLRLSEVVPMPTNNFLLVYTRRT